MHHVLPLVLFLLLMMQPLALWGQTQTPSVPAATATSEAAHDGSSAAPSQPFTLHVYESLVQVPTLVLTPAHESYPGLQPTRFYIQLDGGARFHPTRVHLEGDDPISLAVLLDAHAGEQQAMLDRASQELSHIPPDAFTEHDHLSVFAFDCSLVHATLDQPAGVSPLAADVGEVLTSPRLHTAADGSRCHAPLHLWDAVATVTGVLGKAPGRRVLLVLTDGQDQGSKNTLAAITQYATTFGVAVFAIEPAPPPQSVLGGGLPNGVVYETALTTNLGSLCGSTGGMVVGSNGRYLAQDVTRVMHLVRSRYILEFPRFRNSSNGVHEIDVTTNDFSAVVRTSGVSVPLEDKSLASDPNTVHSNDAQGPTLGQSRKSKRKHS